MNGPTSFAPPTNDKLGFGDLNDDLKSVYDNAPETMSVFKGKIRASNPENPNSVESKSERHIRLMLERLARIDREFADNKTQLYAAKAETLKDELRQIQKGTHPMFVDRLKELERERDDTIDRATMWRDYQLSIAKTLFHQEREQIEQDYLQEKNGLKEKMLQQLEERRKRLREDRETLTIENDGPIETMSRFQMRKNRRKTADAAASAQESRASKRRQQQGPPVQLALKENEIMEDLFVLSKLDSASRKMTATGKRQRPRYY